MDEDNRTTGGGLADPAVDAPGPAPRLGRLRANARLGVRMLLHDRAKLAGTLAGVVFAVVLAAQQLATLFGLVGKNTMFVENTGADVWVVPPGTTAIQPGDPLSDSIVDRARVTPGVAEAQPLVLTGGTMKRPGGGTEQVTLVGSPLPSRLGAPWNVIAGSAAELTDPDAVIVESSARTKLGEVNLGSVRELNGRRVRVVGFTWGLQPFGPPFAFGDLHLVRRLSSVAEDRCNFVLVRARAGEDLDALVARLGRVIPEAAVYTRDALRDRIVRELLFDSPLGISFGFTATFGLLVGFFIVALTMYSAVLDNLREFGTLKAIGSTNLDLALILLVQATFVAGVGSFVGLGLASWVVEGIRSAELALVLPAEVFSVFPPLMLGICVAASLLALARVRRLEPAMVFT